MAPRDKDVYFAKLAEQAERYDEMAEHMLLGQRRFALNIHVTRGRSGAMLFAQHGHCHLTRRQCYAADQYHLL